MCQKRLGAELRKLRESAGLSIELAAAVLECSKGKISRIETGVSGVRPVELRALLAAYGVEGSDLGQVLLEMAREGRKRGWWNRYGDVLSDGFADLAELESKANRLLTWETILVPGLLQTPDYVRVLFQSGRLDAPKEEMDRYVDGRMHRQQVLDSPQAPALWAVLYEPVLHAKLGGSGVMRGQLTHLAHMAQRERVTVQVLPYTAEAHQGLNGPFGILGMPGSEIDVVRTETAAAALYIEDENQVNAYRLAFDQLRAAALGPAPSLSLIREMAQLL